MSNLHLTKSMNMPHLIEIAEYEIAERVADAVKGNATTISLQINGHTGGWTLIHDAETTIELIDEEAK
jgi:hypothetical protein